MNETAISLGIKSKIRCSVCAGLFSPVADERACPSERCQRIASVKRGFDPTWRDPEKIAAREAEKAAPLECPTIRRDKDNELTRCGKYKGPSAKFCRDCAAWMEWRAARKVERDKLWQERVDDAQRRLREAGREGETPFEFLEKRGLKP